MVNLSKPFSSTSAPTTSTTVTSLRIYPIKSCRGISVSSSYLSKTGLDLDRQWMFADINDMDAKNKFITIRQVKELTLIDTAIIQQEDGKELLQTSIRGTDRRVRVPARPTREWLEKNATLQSCNIWDYDTDGWVYNEEINSVFRDFLAVDGRDAVLIYKGPTARVARGNADAKFLGRESHVNFPDVMPLQIANEASIRELNKRLRAKGQSDITIERFRPNIIVKGAPEEHDPTSEDEETTHLPQPWSEDTWKTLRILPSSDSTQLNTGISSYLPVALTNTLPSSLTPNNPQAIDIDIPARCARCQVPNVDPETAHKNEHEPWDTLVSYRRVDEGIKWKPCFGMLACPRIEGAEEKKVEVGMRVVVVEETGGHKYVKGF